MSGHRVVASADVHFYSSTKYAVTALTEGLRQELREANTHIRATVRDTKTVVLKLFSIMYLLLNIFSAKYQHK